MADNLLNEWRIEVAKSIAALETYQEALKQSLTGLSTSLETYQESLKRPLEELSANFEARQNSSEKSLADLSANLKNHNDSLEKLSAILRDGRDSIIERVSKMEENIGTIKKDLEDRKAIKHREK